MTTEVSRKNDLEETIWIKISNQKLRLRIGAVYAPQEDKTSIPELEKIYEDVSEQRDIARKNCENFIISGDLNAKIDLKKGDKSSKSTKAGRILQNFTKKNRLYITNCDEKTKGFYTRIQGNEKSVIDYIIIDKKNKEYLLSASIDEEKLYTPYHIDKGRTVYADHNAFIITMNWEMEKVVEKDKRKLMKFGKSEIERYKKLTNGKNFTKIATESTADTNKKYKQWENELKKSAKLCFKKVSINKYSRQDPEIARMMKRKRKLKKAGGDDPINRIRDRLINEQIEKLLCEQQKRKVDKTVQKIIEAGGVNSPEFWEILKVKSKKQETRCAMKDKNGNLKETEEEIQKVYQDHYNELLKTPSAASKEEEDAEKEVEENFDLLKRAAENNIESEEITMEELNTAIKQLKKEKAFADIGGMKAEYGVKIFMLQTRQEKAF
ncbi:uncharacterized protein [Clytia hemisphaerica]|uniref:uncharacterized protein n=1 Tax=Clytia hemisphaerica TaxID=252671 RepID=UPI0034D5476B